MILTEQNFPAVFSAFTEIDYDNGAVNRLEPAKTEYEVPNPWAGTVPAAQASLSRLTHEELNTYFAGEYEDMMYLGILRGIPSEVNDLLNAYFEGWPS